MARRPNPSAMNELAGNPGKRARNRKEPKPTPGAPSRPTWLSAEAKREWTRIEQELSQLGLLTKLDRGVLAAYCHLWGQLAEAAKAKQPVNVAALTQMRLYMIEMGLTPAARAKLQTERGTPPAAGEANPFGELLAKAEGARN